MSLSTDRVSKRAAKIQDLLWRWWRRYDDDPANLPPVQVLRKNASLVRVLIVKKALDEFCDMWELSHQGNPSDVAYNALRETLAAMYNAGVKVGKRAKKTK